jgi:hypothetical protein
LPIRWLIRPPLIMAVVVCNELPTVRLSRHHAGGWRGESSSVLTRVHRTRMGALLDILNPRSLWQSEDYHIDCYLRLGIWSDYNPMDYLPFKELFRMFDDASD